MEYVARQTRDIHLHAIKCENVNCETVNHFNKPEYNTPDGTYTQWAGYF